MSGLIQADEYNDWVGSGQAGLNRSCIDLGWAGFFEPDISFTTFWWKLKTVFLSLYFLILHFDV